MASQASTNMQTNKTSQQRQRNAQAESRRRTRPPVFPRAHQHYQWKTDPWTLPNQFNTSEDISQAIQALQDQLHKDDLPQVLDQLPGRPIQWPRAQTTDERITKIANDSAETEQEVQLRKDQEYSRILMEAGGNFYRWTGHNCMVGGRELYPYLGENRIDKRSGGGLGGMESDKDFKQLVAGAIFLPGRKLEPTSAKEDVRAIVEYVDDGKYNRQARWYDSQGGLKTRKGKARREPLKKIDLYKGRDEWWKQPGYCACSSEHCSCGSQEPRQSSGSDSFLA